MKKSVLMAGIVGGMLLTGIYAIAQTASANPRLGAAPESDKNMGRGPNDSTVGSDKRPTKRRIASYKGKRRGTGLHKSKDESPAQSGEGGTAVPS